MTDRATLLALAERCEQASGPDLELDRRIDHARWPVKQPAYHLELSLRDHWDVPAFTSSLDAAVTLVPDDYGWQMRRGHVGGGRTVCYLWDGKGIWSPTVVAATPALALCAAALRARAAEDKS